MTELLQFHFLRPLWLLGLLLLPLLYWFGKNSTASQSSWSQAINPDLLKYLLDDASQSAKKWPLGLFIAALGLCFIALAGPVWKKLPQPVHQVEDALVVVLDQSLSLLATDLKPSRQVVVKHKLIDLLKARKEGQTALIVYAGDAHIVSPLTDDTRTIQSLVPALSPLIMPALGSRVERGVALASQALHDGGISKGRILLITDGIGQQDIETVSKQLRGSQHAFSILVVGTDDGGPIPLPNQGLLRDKGEIVIAKTNFVLLQQLAQQTGALISKMTLNDGDLQQLLPRAQLELGNNTRQLERELDQWHEQGPWLLIFILPFAALAFRRGWLLSLLLVVLIQLPPAEAIAASSKQPASSFWKTPNQLGAEAFKQQDYGQAQQLFADPQWQGSAAYRAGDYDAAAHYFAQSDSAAAHYNRGNALVQLGQLEAASKAYDEALERNPELADARANKSLVEKLARQQQNQSGADSQTSDNEQNQQPDQQPPSSAQNSDSDAQSDNQSGNQPASRQSNEQAGNQSSAQQQQQATNTADGADSEQQSLADPEQIPGQSPESPSQFADNKATASKSDQQQPQENSQSAALFEPQLTEEQQQAMEQWLRRIPDDPSVLLKNKFNYQYQQNRQNNEFLPQQEDEAIW